MPYKTIILDLIQEHTELHEQLRSSRILLPTVDRLANLLRESHQAWIDRLHCWEPTLGQTQASSEALERAIRQFEMMLAGTEETEPFDLDEAIGYVRQRLPRD